MLRFALVGMLALLVVAPLATAQIPPPTEASLVVVVVTHLDGSGWEQGTGFLVSPNGLVLTASHVLAHAVAHPRDTHILALWTAADEQRRYFTATLVCASRLRESESSTYRTFGRDIAVLQLAPVPQGEGWWPWWGFTFSGGSYVWDAADTLPTFTPLPLAAHGPTTGQRLTAPGFDHISAFPRLITAKGTVTKTWTASDGTPLVGLEWTQPTRPGGSGSPLFASDGTVVGMWAWYDLTNATVGTGEGADVLHHPCGSVNL